MILHHIPQCARLLEVTAAAFDANALRHRNLHIIHVVAVPNRLENPVGESKDQDILNGLFAQVVIDAIDLVLFEDRQYMVIELVGACQITAKRFFNNDARPVARLGRFDQVRRAQERDDRFVDRRRRRKIEEPVAANVPLLFQPLDPVSQTLESLDIVVLAGNVKEARRECFPGSMLELDFGVCHHACTGAQTELRICQLRARETQYDEIRLEQPLLGEFVKRG